MTTRILGWVCGIGALAVPIVGLVATTASGCEQPKIDCRAARGDFAATYTKISGDEGCGSFQPGEIISLESFYPSDASGKKQDYTQVNLAIASTRLADLRDTAAGFDVTDPDPAHKAYAYGKFDAVEPSGDVCTVPTLVPGQVSIPEIPPEGGGGMGGGGTAGAGGMGGAGGGSGGGGGMAGAGGGAGGDEGPCPEPPETPFTGQEATEIRYDWSDVKLYVSASVPGTMMRGKVKYHEKVGSAECNAEYSVLAIWPVIDCTKLDTLTGEPLLDASCNPQPDETLCHAANTPGAVQFSPEFKTQCDPNLLICIPTAGAGPLQ